MDWETYKTIIDKVMAYTPHFSVEYAGMGEPLLNPLIYDFIKYVSDKGTTSLTTNLSALAEKNAQSIIDAGLRQLTVSFNGADKTSYELMMGGLNFERAQKNLRTIIEMSKGSQTKLGANVAVTRQTQGRLGEIREYLEDLGIETIAFSKCHNRGGFLKGNIVCDTPPPPSNEYRCDIFTNTMFIAWTGEVLSCCHDLAGANVIGDLKTETIETIQRTKGKIAREGVKFTICSGCNDMYRFMNDKTPDGRPLSTWIYDLYTKSKEPAAPDVSSLSEWIQALYNQEEQSVILLRTMVAQIRERERDISALDAELQLLQLNNAELQAIRDSRSWRLMTRVHKIRHWLIPVGSRGEALFHRLLKTIEKNR